MEKLEFFLSVIGAVSIIISIVRFIWLIFSSHTEWIDNLSILVEEYDEDVDYDEYFAFNNKDIYPTVFKDTDCEPNYPTVNFFIPQNTIIRKLKIKKVSDESIADGSMKYKTVKVIKNITPDNPLCMIVGRGECIARYKISWSTLYGGRAEYYFYENSRNGTYNKSGIQYSYGFVSRIRKFFGLIWFVLPC